MNRKNADVQSLYSFLIRWHEMNDDAQSRTTTKLERTYCTKYICTYNSLLYIRCIHVQEQQPNSLDLARAFDSRYPSEKIASTLQFVENVLGLVDFWRTH